MISDLNLEQISELFCKDRILESAFLANVNRKIWNSLKRKGEKVRGLVTGWDFWARSLVS